jgi:iron(II)-dependent oxidoreductase
MLVAVSMALPSAPGRPQPAVAEDMVRLAGGLLRMGREGSSEDERPIHDVGIAAFSIDRTPVTNAEFAAFLNAEGLRSPLGHRRYDDDDNDSRIHRRSGAFVADQGFERHPVVEASWFGARDYCAWRGARLPTEAEWEFAARGTSGRRFPWGDEAPDPARARFASGWNATLPVGTLASGATREGVLDLAGNVHQWTSSLYRSYPYDAADGREDGESTAERVTRGGAHDSQAEQLSTTWRGKGVSRGPRAGHHNIGFRCVR